jgi:general secretion pathway protein K
MSVRPVRSRGFALLLVLWTLVPVSILFITMSGLARSDSHLTFNLRDAIKLRAAADGGITTAIFRLLGSAGATAPIGLHLGDAAVGVRITSLAGLVNPNIASPQLLRALLQRLGADPSQAQGLALAIVDWRTPGQKAGANGSKAAPYRAAGLAYGPPEAPFETIDELRDVIGMTPDLFNALQPYLTLYTDRPPDAVLAPPVVRAALGDLGAAARPAGLGDVFDIEATAVAADGGRIVREAVVKFGPAANGRPWRLLSLQAGRTG